MTEQEIYKDILENFSRFPIPEDESTFLDLCHYSGERFEEICSRILEFYFQPNNKHGFRNLWYRSLCQLITCEYDDAFKMTTRVEEFTYSADEKQKRIDMILETPSRIIAIENKIWAGLYNHLNIYKEHIEKTYPHLKQSFIVLTAHPLSKVEREKAKQAGFEVIGYVKLFNTVKSLLGEYVARGDQKYLVFMLDFMKTVENRVNMIEQPDLDKFLFNNRIMIDSLVKQYNNWKERPIKHLQTKMQELTERYDWKIYQSSDLWISFNDNTPYRIGIESWFIESNGDPWGEFHIFISTWDEKCWTPYEKAIIEKYPKSNGFNQINKDNRVRYQTPAIKSSQFGEKYIDEIIGKLIEYYQFVEDLASKISQRQ